MHKEQQRPVQARAFVLIASLIAAAVVWLAVVKAVGYSPFIGFLYFLGYFISMIIFFEVFDYSLFGGKE